MGWFSGKDEKEYGHLADAARDLQGEGGSGKSDRSKGDLYSHRNIKTGPVTSIKDTINFLRGQ